MELKIVGAVRAPPDLEARVEKLEKANRRITWIALAFGAGFILMFALAASKPAAVPDVIRAKKLEIVDDKGKVRISMDVSPNGYPFQYMYDDKGNERVLIGVLDEGAFMGVAGEGRADAMLTAYGFGPELELRDTNGMVRANIWAQDDSSGLVMSDDKNKARLMLSDSADGSNVQVFDKDKKVIWQAPPK